MATPNFLDTSEMLGNITPTNNSKEFINFVYQTVNQFNKTNNGKSNPLINLIMANLPFFYARLEFMLELKLSLVHQEFYIFIMKGNNLSIDPTPKGVNKIIATMAKRSDCVVISQNYTIREGDSLELPTVNGFDSINHSSGDAMNMLMNSKLSTAKNIVGLISHIKILQGGNLIASHNVIIPKDEVTKILKVSGSISTNYFSTWAGKTLGKRVLKYLLSVFTDDDGLVSKLEEDMRQDEDSPSVMTAPPTTKTQEEIKNAQKPNFTGTEIQEWFSKFANNNNIEISKIIGNFSENGIQAKDIKFMQKEEIETFLNMLLPKQKKTTKDIAPSNQTTNKGEKK